MSNNTKPILEARNVAKSFGSVIALKSASLTLKKGEVHGLLGANGAGKSTFIKILTGALKPSGGELCLKGAPYSIASPAQAAALGIVSVYQEPSLVPHLTIRDNVRLSKVPFDAFVTKLDQFGLGALDMKLRAQDVPLPLLQMIDIARAVALRPEVLILDEVTAALSTELVGVVENEILAFKASGGAVVYISHRLPEIEALCDRSTVLRDGVVAGVVDVGAEQGDRIVSLMLGDAGAASAASPIDKTEFPASGNCVLSVHRLSAGRRLTDVSFELREAEVLGIAAPEGQGQEELFECLFGLRKPSSGNISFHGKKVSFSHPASAIEAGVALVPAERSEALLAQRSITENIWLPNVRCARHWGPIRRLQERKKVSEVIDALTIDTRAKSEVSQLSGGNQQKVVVGRWLAHGFDVLLCFDPTRGIDVGAKAQIYRLMRELQAKGRSVIYYTSDLTEIEKVCDRAVVLMAGTLQGEFERHSASEDALLRAAHGL